MIYSIISTAEYVLGRLLLFSSRFDNVFTGNNEQTPEFCRSCLQWVSNKSDDDLISVLTVVNSGNDGGYRVFDLSDKVGVVRGNIEDLSELDFIKNFNVICIFGVDNNISPLIRLALEQYVSLGGGLILSDILVDAENVEVLDNMAPVYCLSSGLNLNSGRSRWTETGSLSPIYNSFDNIPKITVLNTIQLDGLSLDWTPIYVFDNDSAHSSDIGSEIIKEVESNVYMSSDYDISGDRIVGYFSGIYKNGVFKIDSVLKIKKILEGKSFINLE